MENNQKMSYDKGDRERGVCGGAGGGVAEAVWGEFELMEPGH